MSSKRERDPARLRVGIVGAGPAGLSLAYHLSGLGFDDVTIFDAASEVGGQSVTLDLDGAAVELGTCYLSAGYVMARKIARQLGCAVELLPPATVLDEQGQLFERDDPSALLIARYLGRWLGWYLRRQMQRPTHADNALTFAEWLRARRLTELTTDFTFSAGLTAQLYGPIDSVTAHSALTWVRPSLFITGRFSRTYALREGFQELWRRVLSSSGARVELGQVVEAVEPTPDGPRLLLAGGPRGFDLVFVACPLDSVNNPLTDELRRHDPFDSSGVYSAAWRGRGWPSFAPSRCYLPACTTGEPGRVLTARRFAESGGVAVGQLCAYARPGASTADHRQRVVEDLEQILGLTDIELVEDRCWRYNIRYSGAQLRSGLPATIAKAQGQSGVWYSGGALSHWNVDSITDYNHALARRVAGALGLSWWRRLRHRRVDELVRDA